VRREPDLTRSPGLGELLTRARFEVIPLRGAEEQVVLHLPRGSAVTVTCSPGKGPDPTLELAERLAARGFHVIPHVSARSVRGRGHLEEILGRLDAEGLRALFVIGGDSHDPVGPYGSAGELLAEIADVGHRLDDIGVGGYPEGHPLISDEVLMQALEDKRRFATHVATQICFDPEAIARWVLRIRERGIDLPVYVGMPGVVKRRKLLEVSLRVGVGDSVRFMSKHGSLVARLMRRSGYRPDAFVARTAPFATNPDFGVRGFHVFTFNQVESTERWRRQIVDMYGSNLAGHPIPSEADEDEEEDAAS
jgi:methylenetetrahydrofolate reductase (NADPH)